jgi:hypothetical protein
MKEIIAIIYSYINLITYFHTILLLSQEPSLQRWHMVQGHKPELNNLYISTY